MRLSGILCVIVLNMIIDFVQTYWDNISLNYIKAHMNSDFSIRIFFWFSNK